MIRGLVGRSHMSKAMASMPAVADNWEKQNHRATIRLIIEKKMVDGKEICSYKLDRGCSETREATPLPEEYTDIGKFTAAVSETIKAKAESI